MGYSSDIFSSEPSESCICVICRDVLKDASSLNCGHTFCAGCLVTCRTCSNPSCPNCRKVLTGSHPNYVVRDIIGALEIKCPNSDECNWTGLVKDLERHETTCMYQTMTCDVEGCDHTCQRKDMRDHATNPSVILSHMELKYGRKLKEMDEKYKRLEDICKELELKLDGYENRMSRVEGTVGVKRRRVIPIDKKDIMLVMTQANCSEQEAIRALQENDNDLVNAIMDLTT